jgi:translation initiation factor eIF-2B subunit delta
MPQALILRGKTCYEYPIGLSPGAIDPMRTMIASILRGIREDRTTRAVELVKKGVDAIALLITQFQGDGHQFFHELVGISNLLISCQPSMTPFFHLANTLLMGINGSRDVEEMKHSTKEAIKSFILHLQRSNEEISMMAGELIPEGGRVLTHSFSSTVLRTLLDAKKEKKNFEVICTESRPQCEGFQMARKLSQAFIKVQVQIDSAAVYSMKDAHVVLVGADCVTPVGLVNKVGTYGLAVSAREKKIPFYVLCGTDKLLAAGMVKKYRIQKKDPREVWPDAPDGVDVLNVYHDITPLDLISAIFTEEKILRGNDILRRFQSMKVSEYFPL